ncbi:polyphosphate:AMP phosphotransferase [Candidatus Albibeggiatoa sp. nov. NOAA]|uniref:polyphosphate:AMP phosphotransferase n=1 Tax=Candidatus Albibeggiatoa sp. nov. NOAA TaxID=3162724 RepID=UPI0032F520EA|nr:polyphosphate:AMP phosphotransferase [Thiotrichaceae bacterium]
MFEAAEVGRKISKSEYKAQLPELRAQLLQAQFALSKTNTPVIIIISGVDAAGRGDAVNALNEWLDTRGLETISLDSPTDEELERPYMWRYWRKLPERGRIGIFFGGWYADPIRKNAYGDMDVAQFDESLTHIRRFENMLVEDGALILKFWLHLSKDEQKKRLDKLEKDPHTRRSVSEKDWKHAEMYENFTSAAERTIRYTDAGRTPWFLVEASNEPYRNLTIAHTLLEHLHKLLDQQNQQPPKQPESEAATAIQLETPDTAQLTVLDKVDLTQALNKKVYQEKLAHYQGKLHRLSWAAQNAQMSTIIVFEGWDAGGKGGAIRRMIHTMDARLYRVISIAAPTDEERAHHYLWRFWRHAPRAGHFTIYDRSWYGRVLVERVEGFAKEYEWKRAYSEINSFEEQLANHGDVVIKFWLHISQEEQLKRFKEREVIPYKQHKITEEDWRNRDKWDDYALAVNDMVARTSTQYAPWTLIAGDDKRFARIEALKTVCERLEKALDEKGSKKK